MEKELLFSMNTAFRGEYSIYGYKYGGRKKGRSFGKKQDKNQEVIIDMYHENDMTNSSDIVHENSGNKAACIVGAMRGTEYQQLYICSLLSKKLAQIEQDGDIVGDSEILIIPSLNYSSLNADIKYWLSDESDINRQFPGNPNGPATSRIADSILGRVKEYTYGIQFPSFYLQGEFIPHVRMMRTGHESTNLANLFGLPYVLTSDSRSFDHATLNYNWQIAGTEAFSIYSGGTEKLDQQKAEMAVSAVLRFLTRMGIIRYNCHGGYISTVMHEEEMISIKAEDAGFFHKLVGTNQEVTRGQVLAEIVNPMDGNVRSKILSPTNGIVFFVQDNPMVYQNVVIYKIIRKIHK